MHQDVGALLVIPVFRQLIERDSMIGRQVLIPTTHELRSSLRLQVVGQSVRRGKSTTRVILLRHGWPGGNVIVGKIVGLVIARRRNAGTGISQVSTRQTFVEIIGDDNSDSLSREIRQDILDGTPPTSINHIARQRTWYLQCEIKRLLLSRQ